MTEAMKTLDAGMAAAVLEVRASSKALPVTAPACNPDGASAEVKQDAPASSPSDVAIASIGRSDPVSHGDSGSGRIDQAAASIGQSSDTSRSGMPEAGQSTGPGQNTRGALGASAMANASARNVSQGVSRGALDAAVPGRTPTSDTSTSSIALQLSAADPADNSPSNHAYSASDSATSPVGLRSSEQTGLASVLKKPGNDSMQAAHTVTLHVDASSSTATQQRSAHGQNAAQSRSEAQGSDATTASSLIGQEAGQLTAMSQSSQSSDPSQPAAAILQHPVVAGMSQAGAASSTADQGELIVDGLSPVKAVATQAASADAGLPDHIPTACAVAVTTAAGKTPAAMQQPLEGSPAVVVKPVPAWFAEEGHFALMLQDFTVRCPNF